MPQTTEEKDRGGDRMNRGWGVISAMAIKSAISLSRATYLNRSHLQSSFQVSAPCNIACSLRNVIRGAMRLAAGSAGRLGGLTGKKD